MTHYKLYSLHLGCGEPLAARYQPAQAASIEKKTAGKKPTLNKPSQVMRRKRK